VYTKLGLFLSVGSDRSVRKDTYATAWERLQGNTASAEELLGIDLKMEELCNRASLPSLPKERLNLLLKELGFD